MRRTPAIPLLAAHALRKLGRDVALGTSPHRTCGAQKSADPEALSAKIGRKLYLKASTLDTTPARSSTNSWRKLVG